MIAKIAAHLRRSLLNLILMSSHNVYRACLGCGIAVCVRTILCYSLLAGSIQWQLSLLS